VAKNAEAYKETQSSDEGKEKRYPDPYGLYRRWFEATGNGQAWTHGETVSPEELGELWERWFETMSGTINRGIGAQGNIAESMSPLWEEMAGELREES